MTTECATLSRRTLLGAALAVAVAPRAAASQEGNDPASQEPTDMKIRMMFNGRTMTAALYNNPSARDFFSMLPLDVKIEDHAHNEKIAYLPRKLTEEGSGPFANEQPYDLYFMPWGNLAMFYANYRHPGLIRLGRFNGSEQALHIRGEFPLRIERI
ncbi:cyclophilin-like fold protein [Mesorhizobium australicum]|uniref:Cyclophilin-like fold protein n=1 Tax=Mesorhizobium australicum TaxID=536018 RepID=A0ACC6T528_9HYPH|nr:cyclophilin-like fold protein [Mesorhizobium sp. LNHC229A00]ESY89261.1 MFS transporter [Mesorhizobium sp. LNHC229A00]